MTANLYQKMAARTINQNLNSYEIEDHALHGIAAEVGEIHSLFQKCYQGHTLDPHHLQSEIGNLLWFIAELCSANNWELDLIMEMNIDKLLECYPDGFDAEHSLHRKDGDI